MEVTTTKINPMTTPELHVWGWDVALYLFFSGMAAGVLILVAIQYLYFGGAKTSLVMRYAAMAASIVVPLAMLGLLSDLENKLNILAFYKWWNWTSTMALGARGLLIIPPIGILFGLSLVAQHMGGPLAKYKPWAEKLVPYKGILARATLISGIFLGIYTGGLLSANFGRPLWNTAILPLLFLVSGLSTGAAIILLFSKDEEEITRLTKLDINLILGEISLLVIMFLSIAYTMRAQHESLYLFFGGGFTASFWVLVVGVGLVVPLILEQLQVKGRVAESPIPSWMVLAGGLALRVIIVLAGQASTIPN